MGQKKVIYSYVNATFTKVKGPITRDLFDQSPKFKRQNIRRQKLPTLTKLQLHNFCQINFMGPNVILTNSPSSSSSSCSSSSSTTFISICAGWILAFDGLLNSSSTWHVRNEGFFEFSRITVTTVRNVVFREQNSIFLD